MFTVLRLILGWRKCPKEVPVSFEQAMEKTCAQIIERERIKKEWAAIWKAQGRDPVDRP